MNQEAPLLVVGRKSLNLKLMTEIVKEKPTDRKRAPKSIWRLRGRGCKVLCGGKPLV